MSDELEKRRKNELEKPLFFFSSLGQKYLCHMKKSDELEKILRLSPVLQFSTFSSWGQKHLSRRKCGYLSAVLRFYVFYSSRDKEAVMTRVPKNGHGESPAPVKRA